MSTVGWILAAIMSMSALLTSIRFVRGPSMLDRVVALDMLLAVIVCGLGVYAAITRDSTVVPVLVVVALLGFVGSVAIARFVVEDDE